MCVVLLAADRMNLSPTYTIQVDYASTNAVLRKLESLLQTARATGSTVGDHQEV